MSEAQEIAAVANILRTHGDTFSGGRPEEVAADWLSYDFSVEGISAWCEAGCWDANTADDFETAGLTPEQAKKACDIYDEAHEDSDSMYAICNNDLTVEDVVATYNAWRNS